MSILTIEEKELNIEICLYGEVEKFSPTLSKCRCRIFYRGLNRNRTFISEEFAEELINSLPYVPIKGIFSCTEEDYTDHGEENDEGRIYGIVPENPNVKWEKHLDEDGIEREYVCCDVYLFTALYPEASLINGKKQSMEIYKETLRGEWRIWEDGLPYFHFLSGQLLGLQVLGDDIEPCFEGSAFFSLLQDTQEIMNYIKMIKKEEQKNMDKNHFRLSDDKKASMIMDLLNPNCNEAGNWEINYWLIHCYDDYALCEKCDSHSYVRVYYTKTDDDKTIINEMVDVFIVDVTKAEYDALELMKAMGEGSFEKTETNYSNKITTLETEKTEFEVKIQELETSKTEFETKVQELESSKTEFEAKVQEFESNKEDYERQISELDAEKVRLNSQIEDMNNERQILVEFKANIEKAQKEEILKDFSASLSQEAVDTFTAKMGDFSVEDFTKEISFAAYQANPALFSKSPSEGLLYKSDGDKNENGVISILKKHKGGK